MEQIHVLLQSYLFFLPVNKLVLFLYGHDINFYNRAMDAIIHNCVHILFLEENDYLNDQSDDKFPNTNLKDLYNRYKFNWKLNHTTIKFYQAHINSATVKYWDSLKAPSYVTIHDIFIKTNILQLSSP